jgi:hypothetical protein
MLIKNYCLLLFLLLNLATAGTAEAQKKTVSTSITAGPGRVWSSEKANAWYAENRWVTGANFIPSTAINQL